jgi:leader peptidase (prepilin peptidase)/N-methyltransferase
LIEAGTALLFGLLIGSFLNVCIHRWPRNRSVVKPRSHCVRCRRPIAWYDNIPLVSYLILRGRCRHCGKRISWRYPLVEALTAAVFFTVVLELGPTAVALKMCVFSALLIGVIFSDLEKRILPDEFTIGGVVLGLAFSVFVPVPDFVAKSTYWLITRVDLPAALQSPVESAFGALFTALLLYGGGWVYWKVRHKEGLGFGDVKLVAMVGSFLGLSGAIQTLLVGSIAGSIISLAYIKLAGKDADTYELPFGTFLGASALLLVVLGRSWLRGA